MSLYLNASLMLAATLAVFVVLAKLVQAIRSRRLVLRWPGAGPLHDASPRPVLAVEQTYMIDGKRRLLLVRCDTMRVLLLTGGATDLVVSVLPATPAGIPA